MTENTIFVKKYSGLEDGFSVNEKEVWRYSGYPNGPEKEDPLENVFTEVIEELEGTLEYKVCFRRMDIAWENENSPLLPFEERSKDLAKCLKGCNEIVVFAATVGLAIDRQIAKCQRLSVTKALVMNAYGAERIERLCDKFCNEMATSLKEQGLFITPRFSPGYGDLPLESQKSIFKLLDCNRQIGLSLNESLLMTPSKSVTAIFGIKNCPHTKEQHKCSACTKQDCEYREV